MHGRTVQSAIFDPHTYSELTLGHHQHHRNNTSRLLQHLFFLHACMDGWYISVINYRRMDVNNIIHQSSLHAFFNHEIFKGKRLICFRIGHRPNSITLDNCLVDGKNESLYPDWVKKI